MSAWSSSTGKTQLSYADRLRQANKTSASPRQDPSSSRSALQERHNSNLNMTDSQPLRRLSSASSASAATASGSAPSSQSNAADTKEGAASREVSHSPQKNTVPPVNIWEARRKQIAEREAEKEKGHQASLAQQRKASSESTGLANAGSHIDAAGKQTKQHVSAAANGSRKSTQSNAPSSLNPNQPSQKPSKPANPASDLSSSPAPSLSQRNTPAASANKPNVSAFGPRMSNVASTHTSEKADNRSADQTRSEDKAAQQLPGEQLPRSPTASKIQPVTKPQKLTAANSAKLATANAAAKTSQQSDSASLPAQSAVAQLPPSTALSVSTAPTPIALHEDIPASPATVASAIEEVLKNGSTNGAQTEDDDAWLARIHLLNGGQNMPKFGGFANGAAGLSDEAETQAAKNAERAVAAAWGAGKSVWHQSQHQSQQRTSADVSKDVSVSKDDAGVVAKKTAAPADKHVDKLPQKKDDSTSSAPAPAPINGSATRDDVASTSMAPKAQTPTQGEKSSKADSNATPTKTVKNEKPRSAANTSKPSKSSAKSLTPTVPPFEDPNNWPSPLDAGKKTAEKPKPPSNHLPEVNTDNSPQQPKIAKSFIETLDELQLRLAPTATGSAAKKGKKEWVSILPEITHTSANGAQSSKQSRPSVDGKTQGKGHNKQQQPSQQARKDNHARNAGQPQTAQSGKKDGAGKWKVKRKDSVGDMATNPKAPKSENRSQPSSQGEKDPAGSKSVAGASLTPMESKSQDQKAVSKQKKPESSAAAMSTAATPEPSTSESTSDPSFRADSNVKHQSRAPRTNLRPNGISTPSSQPNGVHRSKSGISTPGTNRSSPRGSVTASPQVHHSLPLRSFPNTSDGAFLAAQPVPLYFTGGPSGAATPMQPPLVNTPSIVATAASGWLPYNPYTNSTASRSPASSQISPYIFDATQPLPQGVLGRLLGQIEFYFSQHNLQGDFFLRSKMDSQGWVDVGVVAGFKKVVGITGGVVGMVMDALMYSGVLDVDEGRMRVRKRFGWDMYTLAPSSSASASVSAPNGVGNPVGASGGGGGLADGKRSAEDEDASGDVHKEEKRADRITGGRDDEEPALGVVAASGFGGTLEAQ
ncbi:uncharacterized protein MEPE_01099 [Melanopsichium pennsylvanicum]|uniref:HTH La-type RNA-binding domain-containing protein n=2 Tax=Melanopsichium pennsylvanicum TaxID=63383 RepID=A0AAJ5C3C9_9BASI|nr:putative protein [Melanopsichium pennsylvanicum 4]SNX82393.1 uncharacterized protein MEPE_01099 [Melanopsichium pennsylvanicum]